LIAAHDARHVIAVRSPPKDDFGAHPADHSKVQVASKGWFAMGNGENRSSGPQYRAAPLIISAAMVGVGTVIVLAGLAVGGGHLLTATRRWVNEMEVAPSELARIKWTQAKAAMSAGAQAWQDGSQTVPAPTDA